MTSGNTKHLKAKRNIVFDQSKQETHHPGESFKKLYRYLRSFHKVTINKAEITDDILEGCDLMIFGGPIKLFSEEEFESLQKHLERGGSLAFFIPDGGKNSNINNFLEEYGLNAESDEVIRTSYYKYFHPKHAFISNGVLHHDIDAAKSSRASSNKTLQNRNHASNDCCLFEERLVYVYPNGTTIDSQLPSIPVLSSGLTSIPINQAIAGIVQMEKNDGRVLLMGSADVFADDWIDAEDNRFLSEIFFDFLLNLDNHIKLDRTLVNTSSLEQKRSVPDIKSLSNRVKICLQEEPPLPQDLMKLYDYSQFGFGINLIPEVLKIYKALNVLHKPLTLIAPAFERPIPRLQLATFKPRMRNLSPPSLELFDLDESFADRSARITQLANKCCSDDDIEYFINDTGAIFDITQNFDGKDAKSIITYVFKMLIKYKMSNQDIVFNVQVASKSSAKDLLQETPLIYHEHEHD